MSRFEFILSGFRQVLSVMLGATLIDLTSIFSFSFIEIFGENLKWVVVIAGVVSIIFSIAIKYTNYKHTKEINRIKKTTEKEKLYREISKTDNEKIIKELEK